MCASIYGKAQLQTSCHIEKNFQLKRSCRFSSGVFDVDVRIVAVVNPDVDGNDTPTNPSNASLCLNSIMLFQQHHAVSKILR